MELKEVHPSKVEIGKIYADENKTSGTLFMKYLGDGYFEVISGDCKYLQEDNGQVGFPLGIMNDPFYEIPQELSDELNKANPNE